MTDSKLPPSEPTPAARWPRIFNGLLWAAVIVGVVAIVVARWSAHASDFAFGNIMTGLLGLAVWLALVILLARSTAPRAWWRGLMLAPMLLILIFLTRYKFERFNGELVPQFTSRWSDPTDSPLPELQAPLPSDRTAPESQAAAAAPDSANVSAPESLSAPHNPRQEIAPQLLAPRQSDFAQYLGPDRDAMLQDVRLDPDWDASPPRIVWKQAIGAGWSGFAVQGDVAVTMEQRGQQEWISAYSVLDGALLWNSSIEAKHSDVLGGVGPRSTPTIAHGRVYACSAVSRVCCVELSSGREMWAHELLELAGTTQAAFERQVTWGRSAAPLVVEDLVVVPLGGIGPDKHTLIAFDRESGQERWRAGSDQISYASPALVELSGRAQILLVSEKQVAGYDVASGAQLWSSPWPGSSSGAATASQPVIVDAQHILLTKGYGEGCQLLQVALQDDHWSVNVQWSNAASLRTKFTNSVVWQGYAYGLSDGILECVRLSDGQRQWKKGRYRQGQLLLVGKHLLITAESGELVLVEANSQKFREVAKLPVLGDVTWNTAALSGDRLLMRNSDEAACVVLPMMKD